MVGAAMAIWSLLRFDNPHQNGGWGFPTRIQFIRVKPTAGTQTARLEAIFHITKR
jgi:hypothetical protein